MYGIDTQSVPTLLAGTRSTYPNPGYGTFLRKLRERESTISGLGLNLYVNSLTAMVADMRPLFFELRASLITFPIFVR